MYKVKFYKGDYKDRQQQANADRCICYVEHHLNNHSDETSGYAVTIVATNASEKSKEWGKQYARDVDHAFHVGIGGDLGDGIQIGGYGGSGNFNLLLTHMPAILVEPLFASNPEHAKWIRSATYQKQLASILADSIRHAFPAGGLVGFSVGHKYKKSRSNDRGARVYNSAHFYEADYAEIILAEAKRQLEADNGEQPEVDEGVPINREIKIMLGDQVTWRYPIDEDDAVTFDPLTGVLRITESI